MDPPYSDGHGVPVSLHDVQSDGHGVPVSLHDVQSDGHGVPVSLHTFSVLIVVMTIKPGVTLRSPQAVLFARFQRVCCMTRTYSFYYS